MSFCCDDKLDEFKSVAVQVDWVPFSAAGDLRLEVWKAGPAAVDAVDMTGSAAAVPVDVTGVVVPAKFAGLVKGAITLVTVEHDAWRTVFS